MRARLSGPARKRRANHANARFDREAPARSPALALAHLLDAGVRVFRGSIVFVRFSP
jgi:hypothetical protein